MKLFASFLIALGLAMTSAATDPRAEPDPENTLIMELVNGNVTIELLPDLAPKHVARIRELTREGFYDGIVFHRVMDGFMAQTGDPTGTGRGGSGQNIPAEFTDEPFVRGVIGMARAQGRPDSGDSQFFIVFGDAQFLNKNYTVWGKVIDGMDAVDRIKKAAPGSEMVDDPDKIVSLKVQADIKE